MLQTTVMLKTDWERSTERVRGLHDEDLASQLSAHKAIMTNIVLEHKGRIVKGEGDAFWVSFPSVTSAVHAATEMQYQLRMSQPGRSDGERLAMRIGIAVGDLLHKDGDIFGAAMSLTQRIESIALRDEIYLSHAAWLILNHAEIQTAFVGSFKLKGFDHEEPVYRVVQRPNIRTESQQVIVITDILGFSTFMRSATVEEIAQCFSDYEGMALEVTSRFGGRLRVMAGDLHILSFEPSERVFEAIELLAGLWSEFIDMNNSKLRLAIGAHIGNIYTYRSHLFGEVINSVTALTDFASELLTPDDAAALVVTAQFHHLLGENPLQAFFPENQRLINRVPENERKFYYMRFKK